MQGVTLAIGVFGSILVLLLRPPYALGAYIGILIWYPDYLRVSIGTIDISAGRIVVAVLLLRCLCDNRIWKKFVWSRLDTWVTASMAVSVGIYCITQPSLATIENRGGFLMDTWFAYLAARLIVTDRATLISFVKSISIVLAALAVVGIIECTGGTLAFAHLRRFRPWTRSAGDVATTGLVKGTVRWGLTRALGPFGHPILYGLCFLMFLPLVWALRRQRGSWGKLAYFLSGIAVIGALSSMSSGPWVTAVVVIFCLMMERFKRWVKPVLIGLLLSCIFVEFASNRHFYHVLADRLNPVGGVWWQRARLIDCAIEDFSEWWLAGYGGRDPGWGRRTGMSHTDMNNAFIGAGVGYGIWGVIALCGVYAVALRELVRAHKLTNDVGLKPWLWSLGTILVATIVATMAVSLFDQTITLFYCILGIIGSLTHLQQTPLLCGTNRILMSKATF
jgi:hypothetical protein